MTNSRIGGVFYVFLILKTSFNANKVSYFLFLRCQEFLRTENTVYSKMQSDLGFLILP